MSERLTDLVEWMTVLPIFWTYVLILAIAYTENVIPLVPGDLIVVFGGYLVSVGRLDIAIVILLGTIGGSLGFMTMFAVGRRIGHLVFSPKRTRWLSEARIDQVRGLLDRWGFGLVAANRFLSGLRSVISLTVGMVHMSVWRTALYSTLSAFVWTSILVIVGYFVGENWTVVREYFRNYGWFIVGVIVLFTGFQLVRRTRKKRRLAAETEGS
ncbi:MAG: DedA family protein [Rhodothermia bacterium]|nr:MAG: DedA family protein [Rhodothermia bacterium]